MGREKTLKALRGKRQVTKKEMFIRIASYFSTTPGLKDTGFQLKVPTQMFKHMPR